MMLPRRWAVADVTDVRASRSTCALNALSGGDRCDQGSHCASWRLRSLSGYHKEFHPAAAPHQLEHHDTEHPGDSWIPPQRSDEDTK